MKFSVFHLPRAWDAADDTACFDVVVDQSLLADELGFGGVFLPEHHFSGYAPAGGDLFSTTAFIAPQLKQAYLGTAVAVTPLHHPVRLVEQINTLDQLTKGRILFGLGSGGRTASSALGFGLLHEDQMTYMNSEHIEIMLKLWAKKTDDPPFEFETKYYKGKIVQRVVPGPYRQPHPLLMQVGNREASMERAAAQGWPVFIGALDVQTLLPRLRVYREKLAAANHSPEVLETAMGWTTLFIQVITVGETEAEARSDLQFTTESMERFRVREVGTEELIESLGHALYHRIPPHPFTAERFLNEQCLSGTPDQIVERLRPFAELGMGNIILSFNNGVHSERQRQISERSMRLFAEEVIPRLAGYETPIDPLAIPLGDDAIAAVTER